MALSQRLEFAAWLVERRLAAMLDEAARAGSPERLVAAMRHAALGGGKRLGPFLVIETAALLDVPAEAALDAAAPAGHGQRRSPPRPPDCAQGVRRLDGHPGGRCP